MRRFLADPALVAWALYMALIPIYVIKSGLPQPGDVFILILLPIVLRRWDGKLSPEVRRAFRMLMLFTVWVVAVDYTWMFLTGNFKPSGPDSFLLYPIYYVYNTLIFLAACILYLRHGDLFLRVTVLVVAGLAYLQAAMSFFMALGTRSSLFFNNPNQLGFYALLAATLIAMTHRRLRLRLWFASSAMLCCGYLAMLSASRAAVGGVAILLALLFLSNPKVIVVTCIATITLSVVGPIARVFDAAENRMVNRSKSSQVTFFEERGYDRITQHPEYLPLGAGEGGFTRWDEESHVRLMEIHSSAGTILFSYGILGSLLFLLFGWRVIRGAPLRLVLLLLPPAMYTIAHHGLRFTLLWVLLSVFIVLKRVGPPTTDRIAAPAARSRLPMLSRI